MCALEKGNKKRAAKSTAVREREKSCLTRGGGTVSTLPGERQRSIIAERSLRYACIYTYMYYRSRVLTGARERAPRTQRGDNGIRRARVMRDESLSLRRRPGAVISCSGLIYIYRTHTDCSSPRKQRPCEGHTLTRYIYICADYSSVRGYRIIACVRRKGAAAHCRYLYSIRCVYIDRVRKYRYIYVYIGTYLFDRASSSSSLGDIAMQHVPSVLLPQSCAAPTLLLMCAALLYKYIVDSYICARASEKERERRSYMRGLPRPLARRSSGCI